MIFIHYEQRKVMLSQLHPVEVPDTGTDPPSELRQVRDSADAQEDKVLALILIKFFIRSETGRKVLKSERRIGF